MASLKPFLVTLFLMLSLGSLRAEVANRVALVIGNSAYSALPHLPNAANDARLIDGALKSVGFKTITLTDGSRQQMAASLKTFTDAIGPDSSVLIYYAGHGIQFDEQNYLVPVDSQLTAPKDLPLQAFNLNLVTEQIDRIKPRIAIVVLDACRNNPFKKRTGSSTADDSTPGLARTTGPPGTFIAFATAPGAVAADGEGKNSPFSSALAEVVEVPGLPIEQVFKRVRERVVDRTAGKQVPWDNSSLIQDFFFKDALGNTPAFSAEATQDAQAWEVASADNTPDAYQTYRNSHPDGLFADIAGSRLKLLSAPETPPPPALPVNRTANSVDDITTWNSIASSSDPELYRKYIQDYPNGLFAKLAQLRLEDFSKGSLSQVTSIRTKLSPSFEEFQETPLYPEITECDHLAGHVQEIADPAVGVYFNEIVPDKAIPACLDALKKYPDSMRIVVNYARAIDAAGRHDEARQIYTSAAASGFPIALRSLGDVYRDGRGVEKNMQEARYWYVLGATKKNVFAELNLAIIYEQGMGVSVDKKKAAYWLWTAAKQGFAPAMEKLSGYYLTGDVVGKDEPQARVLLEGAAEMGNVWAEQHLGQLYVDGVGGPKDPAKGREWVEKAALQGNAYAQAKLGSFYINGTGGEKSAAQALKWLTLAKKGGVNDVAATIATLQKNLGANAVKAAGVFAEGFEPINVK